jgi:hypothetical protein
MPQKALMRAMSRWFATQASAALDRAYEAALLIQSIENQYFNGQIISAASDYRKLTFSYFEDELKRYLRIIEFRLLIYNKCQFLMNENQKRRLLTSEDCDRKLSVINQTIAKYSQRINPKKSVSLVTFPEGSREIDTQTRSPQQPSPEIRTPRKQQEPETPIGQEPISDKTSLIPRSILNTLNRRFQEFKPNAESEVVQKFRSSRQKTIVSIQFILTLIIIPILTYQVSKTFLIGPIFEQVRSQEETAIFLNYDLEEEAFSELKRFEENLRFQNLISEAPPLSPQEWEDRVEAKVSEIAEEYRYRSGEAIQNIFADLLAFVVFWLVLLSNRRGLAALKSMLDEVAYGLSDSAKAFIIILLTDMFVGFHSPHGWEVILEGICHHLGIPGNREFIFLFIATFPVILDVIIKYWIFRYLNRLSPTAVATMKSMNE